MKARARPSLKKQRSQKVTAAQRLTSQPPADGRQRGSSIRVWDAGPPLDMPALAEAFATMPERELASSWPAMLCDTLLDMGLLDRPGDGAAFARACNAVALRLHDPLRRWAMSDARALQDAAWLIQQANRHDEPSDLLVDRRLAGLVIAAARVNTQQRSPEGVRMRDCIVTVMSRHIETGNE